MQPSRLPVVFAAFGLLRKNSNLTEDLNWTSGDPWKIWRDQMPIAPRWAYFDHAAVGPLSGPATRAVTDFASEASQLGDTVWPSWNAKIKVVRGQIAELIGAEPAEVCMVPNTSTGINLVAEGWDWQAGDSIVIPDHEFPSNLFPWMNQADKGVELRVVPTQDGRVEIDDLMAKVDDSTRMIAVSWVGYASGFRVDIDQLVQRAHQKGVLVFLDAIQGLGIYDLDLQKTPVDFLAADGHKWLLGPEGAGVAVIRREHQDRLRCGNVGWSSVRNSYNYAKPDFNLHDTAARFEPGSANMVGVRALSASLDLFLQVRRQLGKHAIGERIIGLATKLSEMLGQLGVQTQLASDPVHRSGIVNFQVPGIEPGEVRNQCLEQEVVVSCRGAGVRASIHAYNNEEDLQRLVDVVGGLTSNAAA